MTGAVQAVTPVFSFNLINFDYPRWHTYEQANWTKLDGVLAALTGGIAIKGAWLNNTMYSVNDRVTDASTNPITVYVCLVTHTSAVAPTTFAQDRANNPTYWQQLVYSSVINTGFGLTGGPINGTGTISIDQTQLPQFGRRNFVMNGDGAVNQRWGVGVAQQASNSPGVNYTADRWNLNSGIAGGNVYHTTVNNIGVAGIRSVNRISRTGSAASSQNISFSQRLPDGDIQTLAGKSVTVSFLARASANFTAVNGNVTCKLDFGTGSGESHASYITGTWTGLANAGTVTVMPTLGGNFTRYSFTCAVPLTAKEGAIQFSLTYPTGAAGANDYIDITQIQVELGTIATAQVTPEWVPFVEEFNRCVSFYQEVNVYFQGVSAGTGTYGQLIMFPTMRRQPTATQKAAGSASNVSGIVVIPNSPSSAATNLSVNVAVGTAYSLNNFIFSLNAEL